MQSNSFREMNEEVYEQQFSFEIINQFEVDRWTG